LPAIVLIIVGLIFRDGTPYLFDGQDEVFNVCFWAGVVIVALHLLVILLFGGLFAAVWRKS
jgi:hypothetical protein